MADLKKKITALPPDAAPTTSDLMVTVDNGGDTRSITLAQLAALVSENITAASITPVERSGGFHVGSVSITSTGTKAITGVGFMPKMVLFLLSSESTIGAASNGGIGIGVGISPAMRAAVTATTRNTHGGIAETLTGKAYTISTITAGGGSRSINIEGDLVSMDSDGFTIETTTYVNTKTLVYVCFG